MDGWMVRIERALALLAVRLDDPPALHELAAAACVSPFHFHRIWRAMTGETVGHTIARLRIAVARQRLADGKSSVTDVAMDGGFGTPQSFARTFRKITGSSPSEFLSGGDDRGTVTVTGDAPVRVEWHAEGRLVALRQEGGAYRELNALFGRLWAWADGANLLDRLHGIYGIPLDDPASVAEDQLRYDACLAIGDPGVPPEPFKLLTLPAGDYAALRHVGSHDELEAANQRLVKWLLTSGRQPAELPLFHYFLDDPEEVATDCLRTDVLLLLAPEIDR